MTIDPTPYYESLTVKSAISSSSTVVKLMTEVSRLALVAFDRIKPSTTRNYLVKDLIPREGLTVVWGPPKCGKSFWTFDLVMHVALGWPYRDRRTVQGPVVYVACEGAHGFRARIEAYRQCHMQDHNDPAPFYLVPARVSLVEEHQDLIAEIRKPLASPPVAVVIDTLNRSLTGSENSDEDMSNYIKAADAIHEAFHCAVLIVHHCGVEGTRPRGHTSLSGAVEAQLAVKRNADGLVTTKLEYMKDGPEGDEIHFRLDQVELGPDEDGDQITSCVVREAEAPATSGQGRKLTANQQTMLTILQQAGPAGLIVEEWNEQAREIGLYPKQKQRLYDLRQALKDKRLVHTCGGRWFVTTTN